MKLLLLIIGLSALAQESFGVRRSMASVMAAKRALFTKNNVDVERAEYTASRIAGAAPDFQLHFSDGSSHQVSLSPYNPFVDIPAERMAGSCNYLGTFSDDASAHVAVTGCPGSDKVEVTLLSRHMNGQFTVDVNGATAEIESPWKDGLAMGDHVIDDREGGVDEVFDPDAEAAANVAAQYCSTNAGTSTCTIPPFQKMTMKLGYDSTLAAKESDPTAWISGVMTHTQVFFKDASLGTDITIEVLGTPTSYPDKSWRAENDLASLRTYAQGDTTTDLYAFFCVDPEYWGVVGIAYVGGLCRTTGSQVSLNEWRNTQAATAKVVAHEIGHNMGMWHDFDNRHTGKGCTGVMNYGTTPDTWSTCSVGDFKAHYESIHAQTQTHCLEVVTATGGTAPTTPTPAATCGFPNWKGDNYCDDENNNAGCEFDGGDCCNNTGSFWNAFCTVCECKS